MFFKKISTWLLNFIAPPFCAYCHAFISERIPLCAPCLSQIRPIVSCTVSLHQRQNIIVHALSDYNNPLKIFILSKNYHNKIMIQELAKLMCQRLPLSTMDFDYIVPIPLHWQRKAWRGFNQSEVIADAISAITGKPVLKLLSRKKKTIFQSSLSAHDRADNLKGVFQLHGTIPDHASILLVDDLMTTGSTLHAAGKELLILRPRSIHAAVACRVIS